MKYGDTFEQRSIPEWGTYNVDYNEIKNLIKIRTTKVQAQAISIQDHEGIRLKEFEDELYNELYEQHQRVNLFVQSKSGEISRRLSHLHKQISEFGQRRLPGSHLQISVNRLEKFSKVEGDVLNAGEEIQSLSRFVGAQRLAFRKLLKKYRKWTGSPTLGSRFQEEVLNQQWSFSNCDFEPLLSQWNEILLAVRAPFNASLGWKDSINWRDASKKQNVLHAFTGSSPRGTKSVGNATAPATIPASLRSLYRTGSSVDADTALKVCPSSETTGKAVYWIHPDHLVELHVLLLQYARLWTDKSPGKLSSNPSSSRTSRKGSVPSSPTGQYSGRGNEANAILCGDVHALVWPGTSSESKNGVADDLAGATAIVRYSPTGEAVIVVGASLGNATSDRVETIQKAKIKRKVLRQFLDRDHSLSSPWKSLVKNDKYDVSTTDKMVEDCKIVREWLQNHSTVLPLAHLRSMRTRFLGLGNNETRGLWITLDRNVEIRKLSLKQLDELENCWDQDGASIGSFPFAVLEVRCEGAGGSDLVRALDESHLTERVQGFSLEIYAVAKLYNARGMQNLPWMKLLDRDIRKVPAKGHTSQQRGSVNQANLESANTCPTSTSMTSVIDGPSSNGLSASLSETPGSSVPDQLEAPPLKSFRWKRQPRKEHPLRKEFNEIRPQYQRYWNEFDDGEEIAPNETYTIFVDPDAISSFPGAAIVAKVKKVITHKAKYWSEKVGLWLSPTSKQAGERQPLFNDFFAQQISAENSSIDDDSSSAENIEPDQRVRRYSTFPNLRRTDLDHAFKDREELLLRCCIGSFVGSFALLVVAGALEASRHRKEVFSTDLGITAGAISSLV